MQLNIPLTAVILTFGSCWTSSAAVITFSSQGTAVDSREWNAAGPNLAIVPHPGWAAPLAGSSWVSYGNTGDPAAPGYFMPANGGVVSFFENLTLAWTPSIASITIRADDSAAFYINQTLVRPEAPIEGNTYGRCSDFPVGCTESMEVTLDIASFLHSGENTLRFDVSQRNSISFGLNYSGYAGGVSAAVETPEPASFLLLGAGLVAIGSWRRRVEPAPAAATLS